MPRLGKMRLQNHVLFKDVTFDFDQVGLTVIQGVNLNGSQSTDSRSANTNFVGKSALVSALPDLFLKEGVTGRAKDKFKGGDGELNVYASSPSGKELHYEIRKFFKGRSERFSVSRNGKDITPESQAAQQAMVSKILGRDAMTFSVIDYLDNRQPHPLRTGDTAVRRNFFSNFFDLSSSDTIRKLIAAETSRMKVQAGVRDEVARQLQAAREALKDIDLPKIKSLIESYTTKCKLAENDLDALRSQRAYAQWLSYNRASLKALAPFLKVTSDPKELLAAIKAKSDALKALSAAFKEKEEYLADLKSYTRTLLSYTEKNAELLGKLNGRSLDDVRSDLDRLERKLQVCKIKETDVLAEWAEAREATSKIEYKIQTAEDRKPTKTSGTCDECGQDLDKAHLTAQLDKANRRIAAWTVERDEAAAVSKTLSRRASETSRRVAGYQVDIQELERFLAAYSNLDAPEKPEKPKTSARLPEGYSQDATLSKLAAYRDLVDFLKEASSDTYSEYLSKALAKDASDYSDEAYDAAVAKSHTLSSKLAAYQAKADAYAESIRNRNRLKARLAELDTELEDAEALHVLSKAFASNSGVKQLIIKALCRTLEAKVNSYAAHVFTEPYQFEFDLDTQFTINATRNRPNGKPLVSDVRKLSGAEAGFFDIILALSLRSFQPESQRLNVLILDEMSANYGPDMTAAFVELLPKLNKIVPHIIVVTPRTQDQYPEGTRYYTVVKKGSYSKLVEGKVLK